MDLRSTARDADVHGDGDDCRTPFARRQSHSVLAPVKRFRFSSSRRANDLGHSPASHLPSIFPSGIFAPMKPPTGDPFSMGWNLMVTFMPGENVAGRTPSRPN